jgi:hypothetical protein
VAGWGGAGNIIATERDHPPYRPTRANTYLARHGG